MSVRLQELVVQSANPASALRRARPTITAAYIPTPPRTGYVERPLSCDQNALGKDAQGLGITTRL